MRATSEHFRFAGPGPAEWWLHQPPTRITGNMTGGTCRPRGLVTRVGADGHGRWTVTVEQTAASTAWPGARH